MHAVCPVWFCHEFAHGAHDVALVPLWLVPAAHAVHCRSDELVPLTVMYDPGSHVAYCLQNIWPGVFCQELVQPMHDD